MDTMSHCPGCAGWHVPSTGRYREVDCPGFPSCAEKDQQIADLQAKLEAAHADVQALYFAAKGANDHLFRILPDDRDPSAMMISIDEALVRPTVRAIMEQP